MVNSWLLKARYYRFATTVPSRPSVPKVKLNYASNSKPAEDWTRPDGSVSQLAAFGIVSRDLALHDGSDQAFEAQFGRAARLPGYAPGWPPPLAAGRT
jgi:hypothetical protein